MQIACSRMSTDKVVVVVAVRPYMHMMASTHHITRQSQQANAHLHTIIYIYVCIWIGMGTDIKYNWCMTTLFNVHWTHTLRCGTLYIPHCDWIYTLYNTVLLYIRICMYVCTGKRTMDACMSSESLIEHLK